MIIVKTFEDLKKLPSNVCPLMTIDRFYLKDYNPEKEGWLVYFENADELYKESSEALLFKDSDYIYHSIGSLGVGWENVFKIDNIFVIVTLMNNEFGMTYYIPEDICSKIFLSYLKTHLEDSFTLEEYILRWT